MTTNNNVTINFTLNDVTFSEVGVGTDFIYGNPSDMKYNKSRFNGFTTASKHSLIIFIKDLNKHLYFIHDKSGIYQVTSFEREEYKTKFEENAIVLIIDSNEISRFNHLNDHIEILQKM